MGYLYADQRTYKQIARYNPGQYYSSSASGHEWEAASSPAQETLTHSHQQ